MGINLNGEYIVPPRKPNWPYFFLNGQLHKRLKQNKARNLMLAWNYPEECRKQYLYSEVMKSRQHAYTTAEVCRMFNRSSKYFNNLIMWRQLPRPASNYATPRQPGEPSRVGERFYHSEDDLRLYREFFADQHIGRPRRDGWKQSYAPADWELRQMLENRRKVYTMDDDGQLVPVWTEYNI